MRSPGSRCRGSQFRAGWCGRAALLVSLAIALLRPTLSSTFSAGPNAVRRQVRRSSRVSLRLPRRGLPPDGLGDLAQVAIAGEDDDMGPFGPFILYLMSLDRDTNIRIENAIFGSALLLTLLSLKANFDKWNEDSQEKAAKQQEAVRRALDPEGDWRKNVKRMERLEQADREESVKGFQEIGSKAAAKARRKSRGSRRKSTETVG